MPLTPSDVHDKQFKLVRQTTGYDMDEVDGFLDEVELEIGRLTTELTESQTALAEARNALAASEAALSAAQDELAGTRRELAAAQAQAVQLPPTPAVVLAAPEPAAPEPASAVAPNAMAAARLLELAARTADEHIAQAKADSERIIADAQAQGSQIEARVAALRELQDQVRTQLRGYLETQLRELSALDDEPGGAAG